MLKYFLHFGLIIGFLCLFCSQVAFAQGIDVLHYGIHLKITDLKSGMIEGYTDVTLFTQTNTFALELLSLKVTEITCGKSNLHFKHEGTQLKIELPKDTKLNDTTTIRVHYQGKPAAPSWFGGFYMNENFAYNLGVLFDASPHNFGKCWFPCVDNFTDKALYDFYIQVLEQHTAVCTGKLIEKKIMPKHTVLYHWRLSQPISTYLASVAVGQYEAVRDTFHGLKGIVPIEIYAPPAQVGNIEGSFRNLKFCLRAYEAYFGPYEWERVGYVAVPMEGGAMEHATNIAYPLNFIDGTTTQDRLWAHELSHSWFGNLVTCATVGDMWLNEGFARYSEALYFEALNGKQAIKDYMRKVQHRVLTRTHVADKGYRAVSNMDEAHTYGSTIYDKGATVAHSLRGALGDSLYFNALKTYFQRYKFQNMNTAEFTKFLSEYTKQDLSSFFEEWVHTPGHSFLYVDSMQVSDTRSSSSDVRLRLCRRRIEKKIVPYQGTIDILFGNNHQKISCPLKFQFANDTTWLNVQLPFVPQYFILDPEEKYCNAAVKNTQKISGAGKYEFTTTGLSLTVEQSPDTCSIQWACVYLPPTLSGNEQTELIAPNAFWTLQGNLSKDLSLKGALRLNPDDYFSAEALKQVAASEKNLKLALFHRASPLASWIRVLEIEEPKQYAPGTLPILAPQAGEYALFYIKIK